MSLPLPVFIFVLSVKSWVIDEATFFAPVQPVDNLKDILTHYGMNAVVFKPGYISVLDRSENVTAFSCNIVLCL